MDLNQRRNELNEILKIAVKNNASDIHLKAGLPPILRVNGSLYPLKNMGRIEPDVVREMAMSIMDSSQRERFQYQMEIDLGYGVPGLGRFRVNVFMQRGTVGIALRVIPVTVYSFEELNLPKVLEKLSMETRGLIIVTGTTGCGKSTTLAAMIEHINNHRSCNIITIEDPIEFLLKDKKSIIHQREVGIDTPSFASALRAALRQDPDVIMVGEMRDRETMETALEAAETGHLVLSTLHTLDASETINRIVTMFPPHQHKQIRLQLSSVLKGVISQRLIPRADGKGRVPAVEIMISTARIREYIEDEEKTKKLSDAIAAGYTTYGMQTFDQSLMWLLKRGLITYEEALRQASKPGDFALRVKGVTSTSDQKWEDFEKGKEEDEDRKHSDD